MFAMFDDIYRFTEPETLEAVNQYCTETGADWAMTFYSPEAWDRFERWQEKQNRKRGKKS